ncbi:MAG TPA: AMP-binding protein [Nocardioidaceae bacterium]|nr:AMP-binding protein [Nocardioidaceae bacterium]
MSSPARSPGLAPVRGTAEELLGLLRDWDAADDPAPLSVDTSGSTGPPKRVLLSRAAMRASADATQARLGGPGQWLLALPPTYVAGLQVLFRSVRAGTPPVQTGDGIAAAAARLDGDRRYLSVVPTQLVRMLHSDAGSLRRFDAVLVGGARLDPVLRSRAEAAGVRVVATYGLSETCGGCVYDGVPLDGVRVATADDGRVLIAGPVLFDGYDGQPALTAQVLVDGWLRTQDLGRLDGRGRLEVLGRADDVVVSGGVNVPAAAVASTVRDHPGVRAAEVVGAPDDEWGELVVAVLVGDVPLDDLRDWVGDRHPRSWAPRRVVPVEALPLLPNGKVDRVALQRLAAGAP